VICTECGHNLAGIPRAALCPECGAAYDSTAILEAKTKRDSLAEFALWASLVLGALAAFSTLLSPLALRVILIAGIGANIVMAFFIERAGRLAREPGSLHVVRSVGLFALRITAMWFACGISRGVVQMVLSFFESN